MNETILRSRKFPTLTIDILHGDFACLDDSETYVITTDPDYARELLRLLKRAEEMGALKPLDYIRDDRREMIGKPSTRKPSNNKVISAQTSQKPSTIMTPNQTTKVEMCEEMPPKEYAAQLCQQAYADSNKTPLGSLCPEKVQMWAEHFFALAVKKARAAGREEGAAEQREKDAKIAESLFNSPEYYANPKQYGLPALADFEIASAIRDQEAK